MVESLKLQLTDLNKNMREEEDKLYKKGRERLLFLGTHGAPRTWTGAETNQYERIISEEDRCRSNIINNKDTKKKNRKRIKRNPGYINTFNRFRCITIRSNRRGICRW